MQEKWNLLLKRTIIKKRGIIFSGGQNCGRGSSKNRTLNITQRLFDRFVQHFAYAPYMTL